MQRVLHISHGVVSQGTYNKHPCDPFYKRFIMAQSKYCENSVYSDVESNDTIMGHFCTCHNSSAVVTCAKLTHDWITIFHATAMHIFTRFGLHPLVMWVHSQLICMYVFRLNTHTVGTKSDQVMLFLVRFHPMYVNFYSCFMQYSFLVQLSLLICIFSSSFSLCRIIPLGWCYLFVVGSTKNNIYLILSQTVSNTGAKAAFV